MAPPRSSHRVRRGPAAGIGRTAYAGLGIALALLSLAAVAHRQTGQPETLPDTLSKLLGFFVEPGVLLWWLVLGGPTAAFPADAVGRSIVVAANTAWWLLFALLAGVFVRRLRRRFPGQG